LTNQVRRAAVSIPSNIAEGQGRDFTRDFLHFLSVARGSLQKMETQILIAGRLHYLPKQEEVRVLEAAAEVGRIKYGLARSLRVTLDP